MGVEIENIISAELYGGLAGFEQFRVLPGAVSFFPARGSCSFRALFVHLSVFTYRHSNAATSK